MDLSNLDLTGAIAATAKQICTVTILGALEEADVAASLKGAGEVKDAARTLSEPADPRDLKKLRAKHHSVARMIASGLTQRMVANLAGYTEGYLSTLLNAPAMKELVETYSAQYGSSHQMVAERLRRVGDHAIDEIEDRLEDAEKRAAMDMNELTSIAKLGLDRSGHGPQSSQHIVEEKHVFDHAELRKRDKAARAASSERIIDITPSLPKPAADGEADDGQDD